MHQPRYRELGRCDLDSYRDAFAHRVTLLAVAVLGVTWTLGGLQQKVEVFQGDAQHLCEVGPLPGLRNLHTAFPTPDRGQAHPEHFGQPFLGAPDRQPSARQGAFRLHHRRTIVVTCADQRRHGERRAFGAHDTPGVSITARPAATRAVNGDTRCRSCWCIGIPPFLAMV